MQMLTIETEHMDRVVQSKHVIRSSLYQAIWQATLGLDRGRYNPRYRQRKFWGNPMLGENIWTMLERKSVAFIFNPPLFINGTVYMKR